jgi:hypothetical protein
MQEAEPKKATGKISKVMEAFGLLKKTKKYRKLLPFVPLAVVILGFAVTGLILTIASHAATYTAPKEAEAGVIAGAAATKTDTTNKASGGKYVGFGSSGSTTPPPTTPPTSDPTAATCPSPTPTAPVTGYTIAKCEDFNSGQGAFGGYDGGGGDTVVGGGRKSSQCSDSGGVLILAQSSDGSTCGGSTNFSQRYGFWEARMRAYSTGTSGSAPHPVLILWPDSDQWPEGGELDYFETDIGDPATGFLHCASSAGGNCYQLPDDSVDYSQFHVYGFKWTSSSFTGYIDARQWYTTSDGGAQPPGAMHQTIQLDNLTGNTPVKAGKMEVDWLHMYK